MKSARPKGRPSSRWSTWRGRRCATASTAGRTGGRSAPLCAPGRRCARVRARPRSGPSRLQGGQRDRHQRRATEGRRLRARAAPRCRRRDGDDDASLVTGWSASRDAVRDGAGAGARRVPLIVDRHLGAGRADARNGDGQPAVRGAHDARIVFVDSAGSTAAHHEQGSGRSADDRRALSGEGARAPLLERERGSRRARRRAPTTCNSARISIGTRLAHRRWRVAAASLLVAAAVLAGFNAEACAIGSGAIPSRPGR